MKINTFQVEHWLNTYENKAKYEIAETNIKSFTIEELSQLDPKENLLQNLLKIKLGYNPTSGSESLKQMIADLYQYHTSSENILVTNGAIEANFLLSNILVNEGDKVIVLWPAYQSLYSTAEACGAHLEFWKLLPENRFQPNLDTLSSLIDERTKLLILNTPNNPTGTIINQEKLETILKWAEEYHFYVLCDEVYHDLIFQTGIVPPYARNLSERAISVGSISKAYGLPGLRLGWMAGPKEIIHQCWQYKDYTSISNSPLSDYLARYTLAHFEQISERNAHIIHQNREILQKWFKKNSQYFHYHLPQEGIICFPKLKNISISSKQLAIDLFNKKSLLVVPGECFDMPGYLRIGFGGEPQELRNSLTVFSDYLQENF